MALMIAKQTTYDWQRTFIGLASLGLALVALLARYGTGPVEAGQAWAFGTFGKVAFVLALVWLAWPQLLWLKNLPGGGAVIAIVLAGILIFISRPKLLLYFVPPLVGIASLFVLITWIQRNLLPPK